MSHCWGKDCHNAKHLCQCDCEGCHPVPNVAVTVKLDSLAEGISAIVQERDELKARVAALEEQIRLGPATDRLGNPIDPTHYEVYRDASVLLSTHVAGARGSKDRDHADRIERLWGPVVNKIDECLDAERTIH